MKGSADPNRVHAVAAAQKFAIWAVLAGVVGNIFFPLIIIAIPLMLYAVYQLAKVLEMSTASSVLYMIAMFIPLIGLICLLVLNGKATNVLRDAGVRVGFMGARSSDLPPKAN